jgi:hypothetical protein
MALGHACGEETHNTTFSGHFALPNFGHPFMFANGLTSDSGNGEK